MTAVQTQTKQASELKLAGKVALVTGGSRGIGAAIAQRLAADGATVAISYVANATAAQSVVKGIEAAGGKALAVKADVSAADENVKLVEEVVKTFGKIDILVNNAGVFEMAPIENVDISHYDRVFNVNVRGVIAATVAALPHLNDGGRIINISSGAADATMPGASIYSATKSALDTLSRVWAQDLGKRQITVNSISPGTTVTDMFNAGIPEEARQSFIDKTALGRLGEPADIADVVAFVAGHDSRWITGRVLNVDGGISI